MRSVGGFQHTYCDSFQTEEEFEAMFNHDLWRCGGHAFFWSSFSHGKRSFAKTGLRHT